MKEFKLKLDLYLRWILIFIMGAMVINVLWQVFTGFILQDPSSFTDELARYSLVWLGILGAAYVAVQKMHLAIDLLSHNISEKNRLLVSIFIELCIFLFALVVMVIGGIRLVAITLQLEQISAALQIPLGYVYLVLPISGTLMVIYSGIFLIENFSALSENSN